VNAADEVNVAGEGLSHKSLPAVFGTAKAHAGSVIADPGTSWEVVFSVQGFSDGSKDSRSRPRHRPITTRPAMTGHDTRVRGVLSL